MNCDSLDYVKKTGPSNHTLPYRLLGVWFSGPFFDMIFPSFSLLSLLSLSVSRYKVIMTINVRMMLIPELTISFFLSFPFMLFCCPFVSESLLL